MWRTLLLVMAAQREVFPQYHHNVNKLKSVLGIQGDDDPPTEVLDLFKEKMYDVQSTMNTIFELGGLEKWRQTRARLPPPDSPPGRSQSAPPSSKRQKPDGSTSQIDLTPSERAGLGEAESLASGAVTATVDAIVEGLKSVLVDLPKQVANATAAAVRAFDLAEEEKAAAAATRQSAAPFVAKIDACKNCFDIGKLEGFRFDVRHGDIVCICCFRYASSNYVPQALRARTARNVGVIAGVRDSSTHGVVRGFRTVKTAVKQHVQTQIHQWCSHHEVVESQYASERRRAGVIISKLILQALGTAHYPPSSLHCTHTHTHAHTHTRARARARAPLRLCRAAGRQMPRLRSVL